MLIAMNCIRVVSASWCRGAVPSLCRLTVPATPSLTSPRPLLVLSCTAATLSSISHHTNCQQHLYQHFYCNFPCTFAECLPGGRQTRLQWCRAELQCCSGRTGQLVGGRRQVGSETWHSKVGSSPSCHTIVSCVWQDGVA